METIAEADCKGFQSVSFPEKSTVFSCLPAEIRLKIWKLIHQDIGPRAITLYYNPNSGFSSKTVPPATLFINKESRHEALKYFTPAFNCHKPPTAVGLTGLFHHSLVFKDCNGENLAAIYVNFTQDVVYLQDAQDDAINVALEAMSFRDRYKLQLLAINDSYATRKCLSCLAENLTRALLTMPQLRRLSTVQIDAWRLWSKLAEEEMQHVFFHGYGLKGVWQGCPGSRSDAWAAEATRELGYWKVHIVSANELQAMGGVHKDRGNQHYKAVSV